MFLEHPAAVIPVQTGIHFDLKNDWIRVFRAFATRIACLNHSMAMTVL